MKTHYLKTVQPFFSEVKKGIKAFELRRNDRDFLVGDEVFLQEYDLANNSFSGQEVKAIITYVLEDWKGLDEGYCVFAIEVTQQIDKNVKTGRLV
jgi:ParB family chromosome partitioning protein